MGKILTMVTQFFWKLASSASNSFPLPCSILSVGTIFQKGVFLVYFNFLFCLIRTDKNKLVFASLHKNMK